MESLYQLYLRTMQNHKKWDYYNINEHVTSNIELLSRASCCKCFIKEILRAGDKHRMNFAQKIDSLEDKKLIHTVSVFFLGHIFKEWFSSINVTNKDNDEEFSFLWMLICLFHDIGYVFENGNETCFPNFEHFPKDIPKGIPEIFGKELIQNYYNYRISVMQKNDHGIIGGNEFLNNIIEEFDNTHGLLSMAPTEIYELIVYIIACHNIYFTQPSSANAKCYRCHNLDTLISNEHNISPIDHPLLFLFDLVDSIDPMKIMTLDDTKHVYIDFHDNQVEIDVSNIENERLRKCYYAKIRDIGNWLTKVEDADNGEWKLTLSIKHS